jgi:hypothetical protein
MAANELLDRDRELRAVDALVARPQRERRASC